MVSGQRKLGMFPLVLTVLNGDYSTLLEGLRAVNMRGNIPSNNQV